MGSCVSKGSTASSPQHYAVHYTEQATPSPSSSEASMSLSVHGLAALEPPIARRAPGVRSYCRTKFSRQPTNSLCASTADLSKTRAPVNALPTPQRLCTRHDSHCTVEEAMSTAICGSATGGQPPIVLCPTASVKMMKIYWQAAHWRLGQATVTTTQRLTHVGMRSAWRMAVR